MKTFAVEHPNLGGDKWVYDKNVQFSIWYAAKGVRYVKRSNNSSTEVEFYRYFRYRISHAIVTTSKRRNCTYMACIMTDIYEACYFDLFKDLVSLRVDP